MCCVSLDTRSMPPCSDRHCPSFDFENICEMWKMQPLNCRHELMNSLWLTGCVSTCQLQLEVARSEWRMSFSYSTPHQLMSGATSHYFLWNMNLMCHGLRREPALWNANKASRSGTVHEFVLSHMTLGVFQHGCADEVWLKRRRGNPLPFCLEVIRSSGRIQSDLV